MPNNPVLAKRHQHEQLSLCIDYQFKTCGSSACYAQGVHDGRLGLEMRSSLVRMSTPQCII